MIEGTNASGRGRCDRRVTLSVRRRERKLSDSKSRRGLKEMTEAIREITLRPPTKEKT